MSVAPQNEFALSLEDVMNEHPALNWGGYGAPRMRRSERDGWPERFAAERAQLAGTEADVIRIAHWMRANLRPTKGAGPDSPSSYGTKHYAENDLGYITNGQFIAAAIMAGYPIHAHDYNPGIGVRARDITALHERQNAARAAEYEAQAERRYVARQAEQHAIRGWIAGSTS